MAGQTREKIGKIVGTVFTTLLVAIAATLLVAALVGSAKLLMLAIA